MTGPAGLDVRERLSDPALPSQIKSLGFRDTDVPAVLEAAAAVADRPDDLDWIRRRAERLVSRIGDFGPTTGEQVWSGPTARSTGLGTGVLAMLALVVSAPEVASYHARRGIPAGVSTATLADLGQQVWVHRLAYGEFGLHTQSWLSVAWSGALYWLGRLQFELLLQESRDERGKRSEWVLSTHIPRSGPLTPDSVDASFRAATEFFARYFPEYPTCDFYCQSWLLDPHLSTLVPHSNLAAFQRRWTPYGDTRPGDVDVAFFVFNERSPLDPDSLPRDTALRRAIADSIAAGQHWSLVQGRLPQHRDLRCPA
jgi:hypothetical protein